MKPQVVLFAAGLALWLAACRSTATLTPSPQPTVETAPGTLATPTFSVPPTSAPTAPPPTTPAPSLVPVLVPTATALDTPDPNLGVGDVIYQDPLDGSGGAPWDLNDGAVAFTSGGGQLNAVMIQPNMGGRLTVRKDKTGGDQQVRVTTRANLCYNLDEYGLIFRGRVDPLNNYFYYVFKLNCSGQARVELVQNVETTVLVDWTPSPAIVSGAPAENTLLVWAAKDQMHFFVNDRYIASARDATYPDGFWGFYLRDRTNGGESISFVNLVARQVTAP